MPRRNWKHIQPSSLRHALELCKDHARERLNRSVDQIADQIGLNDKWRIYKWIEAGSIPAHLIRPFETACGIDYITRHLAHSAHKLLIEIPTGKRASSQDIHQLQGAIHFAVGELIKYYAEQNNEQQTLAGMTTVMESLAWHRRNVEKGLAPEFDFNKEDNK